MQREIKDTSDELASLKQSAKDVSDEFGNPISPEQYDSLQREIIETQQDLQNLQREAENSRTALVKIGEAGEVLEKAGDKISGAGEKLLPITAGVAALGTTASSKFAEVDKIMQLTNATMKNTEEQADLLDKAMKDAASNSTFGMSDAATATLNFARAGLTAEEAAAALAPAMNLAAGEGGSLDTVSAGLVATINGFHGSFDDAANYADVFAAACNNSALDIDSLSEAMSVAAPIFSTAGYEVNDAALYMGVMANNGIEAEVAANSLKTGLSRLVKPAKEGAAMMDELGISVTNADGTMKDTITIHKELNETFSKLSESEQIAAASAIFGKNQMAPWLALINTAPADVENLSGSINNCAGTTDEMATAMMSGFGGSIEQLKSSIDVLMTSLGQLLAEYLTPIIAKIQEWVTKFNALDDSTKQTIIKIALIAAALGPLLIIIGKTISTVGTLMQFISNIPTLIAGAKSAFAALSGVIGGISAPVVAVVAAIGVLIAAFVNLWKNNEEFRNKMTAIWERIKSVFENLTSGIVDRLNDLGFNFEDFSDVVKTIWQGLCDILAPWFEGVFTYIAETFDVIVDVILGILDIFIGLFTGDWEQMWNGVKGIFVGIWDFIKNSFTNIVNTLKGIADVFLGWFGTSWNEVWTAIKDFFVNIWNNISAFFTGIFTSISNFFTTIWTGIRDFYVGIWTAIYTSISEKITAIQTVITTVWNTVSTAISTVLNAIWTAITTVWQTIYDFISPLLEAFKYLFETIFQAIHIIINNVMDWISEKIQAVWNAIVEFITPILEGIKSFFEMIWNAVYTAVTTVIDAIYSVITTVWNAISGFISGILNSIWSVISSVWNTISSTVSTILNTISSTVSNIWNGIKTTISNVMNAIKTTVTNIWNNVKSAVSNTITGIKDTIVNGFNNAVNFVKNLAGEAWNWGADIISGIVDGIKSKIQAVADAVTGVADKIKSFLHFSVPDEGPLTDFESWMPDFMQGLADGISANAGLVGNALSTFGTNITTALTDTFKTAMSNIVSVVGTFMQDTLTEVTNIWNSIQANMNAVLANIGNGIKSGWNAITTAIKASLDSIKTAVTTSWNAIKNIVTASVNGLKEVISAVWNGMKMLISTGQNGIKNTVISTWNAISDSVRNVVNSVKNTVSDVWNAMPDAIHGAMSNVQNTVLNIWDNIKNGVWDKVWSIRDTVAEAINSAADSIRNIANSSWQWGYDLMQNLVNGIRYMMADLYNPVCDVANVIWEHLHFSVPEKGPLTDFESWMPDFMGGLADGINRNKKLITKAIGGVTSAMQLSLNADMSGISSAMQNGSPAGTVINNYNNDNSRTVNQTNNSPKSLSRLEIYRQTRNALNV